MCCAYGRKGIVEREGRRVLLKRTEGVEGGVVERKGGRGECG